MPKSTSRPTEHSTAARCSRGTSVALALALLTATVHAAPPGNGWFSGDCRDSDETFPPRAQRLLLRVMAGPLDPGLDAVVLRDTDGKLYAAPALYTHLQLTPGGRARKVGLDDWFAFDAIEGLRFQVDPCAQTLSIDTAAAGAARRYVVGDAEPLPPPRSEFGGYAQTDLQYLRSRDFDLLSGLFDLGLFGGFGLTRSSALYDGDTLLRLDTQYTLDDPQRLRRLSLGDGITRGGLIGRSLRYAGIQWGRDFSLRPDLVTFPLPAIDGEAALPSAVDIYVDNQLRGSQDIGAGAFELSQVPVIAGSGEIQLVVTDLLGRSQVLRYDFYVTPTLLRAGLDDYTVEAGFERRRYGIESNRYGRGFAAATWRRGISDQLTSELHVEGSDERQVAGAAFSALMPGVGVVTLGLATGSGDSEGGLIAVGAEKLLRRWSYTLEYQRASRTFLRIGELEPGVFKRDSLRLSWRPHEAGSLSATWLDDRRFDGSGVRGLALGYSLRIGESWFLNLGGFDDRRNRSQTLFAGLTRPFGRTVSADFSVDHDDSGDAARLQVQRNAPDAIGWSARGGIETGRVERATAAAGYTNSAALIGAEVEDRDGIEALRLNLQSGLTWLGRDVFVTRPLTGPFAVVETGGIEDVRVYTEHRLAGDTGARGALLVPGLRPYQSNTLSVAEEDYRVDQRLESFGRAARLPGYGGVRVRFEPDARISRRLLLRLADGSAPPPGADVEVDGMEDASFTGFNGEALIRAAAGARRLRANWAGGGCSASFELQETDSVSQPPLQLACEQTR